MKKNLLLLIALFLFTLTARAQIGINIVSPQANSVNGLTLNFSANITSNYDLDSVSATVADRVIGLTPHSGTLYSGTVPLAGLSLGKYSLTFFAKDGVGHSNTASVSFYYDTIPPVSVILPTKNASFQTPVIRIKARVHNPDNSDRKGTLTFGKVTINFVNTIDTVVTIVPIPQVPVAITARPQPYDGITQDVTAVYIDQSKYLKAYYSSRGDVVDFKDNRVLIIDKTNSQVPVIKIVNTLNGNIDTIKLTSSLNSNSNISGILCDIGAAISVSQGNGIADSVYVWRNNVLTNLSQKSGANYGAGGLISQGHYLVWGANDGVVGGLILTDLNTLNSTMIDRSASNTGYDFSPQGTIVYTSLKDNSIHKYNITTGANQKITTGGFNFYPIVNKNLILYYQSAASNAQRPYTLSLYDGTTTSVLGTTNPSPYSLGPGYGKVAYNGYTAYTKAGLNNIEQVWIRSPDGTSKLETSFATNNVVEKLGNKGSLMFTNGATRYYVDSLNTPSPVNTSFGKVYFVNDQFYVAIGNSLYKYDLPAKFLPKIKSFSPASAGKGGTVTIKGIGFAGTTAVSFGGIAATSFTAVSDSVLTAVVGAGSSGQIAITTPDGTDFAPNFIFIPGPVITSINPSTAILGSSVTITGTNFTGATAVSFGGAAATSFTVNSATSITAIVGAGASGDVTVVSPVSTGNFSGFKFLPVPVITTNGPTSFTTGGSVTLFTATGTGYTYQWLKDGANITGAISSQHTVRDAGSYTVKVGLNGVSQVSAPVIVDVTFTLPTTNFKLTNTGATCRGSANGSISITTQQNLNYTATVTNSNNVIGTYPFTLSTIVPNLAAGSYNVCLTVAGQPDYQQCFTAVITQPKDLDLYSAVIPGTNQVVLSLSGGDSYNVSLNGATTTTTSSQLTLTLAPGKNTILVSTDKECQGQIERMLLLSNDKIIFPNPFVNTLNVNLGTDMVKKATVSIYDIFNNVIYVKTYSNQLGVLQLSLPGLKPGMYMLKVTADDKQSIYKAIKSNVN
jgi:hypothetical protein